MGKFFPIKVKPKEQHKCLTNSPMLLFVNCCKKPGYCQNIFHDCHATDSYAIRGVAI